MRLSCPGCQTEYEVPDAALAGRVRTLRCANCGHQWEYGPLPVTLQASDPAGASWSGAAPRNTTLPEPSKPAEPQMAQTGTIYEPLDPPARGTWPPPPEPIAAPSSARIYAPLTIAEPIAVAAADFTSEEIADEPANAEPVSLPETDTKPAIGNEERFAALVKTSRSESDDEPRPGVRAGLFTTIILLIGIGAGVWAARFHIMQIWPPSIRLFDAINLFITNLTTPAHH